MNIHAIDVHSISCTYRIPRRVVDHGMPQDTKDQGTPRTALGSDIKQKTTKQERQAVVSRVFNCRPRCDAMCQLVYIVYELQKA